MHINGTGKVGAADNQASVPSVKYVAARTGKQWLPHWLKKKALYQGLLMME